MKDIFTAISSPTPMRRWLSPQEAAVYTGISKSWLAKLRMYGSGPAFAKIGKAVRYSRDSLDQWMVENLRSSTLESLRPASTGRLPK